MKAVVVEQYGPVDGLRLTEAPMPQPGEGEVRIRVAAAAIGFVDGLKIQGLYQTKDPLPFIPGMEFSGVVDELGSGVTTLRVGQRVLGLGLRGALAEFAVYPATDLHVVPDTVDLAQASGLLANYTTALYALSETAQLRAGEQLLVLGASGGTGSAAVSLGKLLGARVIAAASTEAKRQFALSQGADAVLDYTQPDWRDTLKGMTGGKGVDVIFDGVGGELSPLAFRALAWRGRHLVVGFAAGKIPALPFNIALLKGASLMGVDLAQVRTREPEIHARLVRALLGWFASGHLTPPAVEVFPFEAFRAAFAAMATRNAIGKMVVRIAPDVA
ncbi:MAG: NADPH:quinone oxidoreductase family protein [Rhizobiales bacterium]|nr:NADPH:quinone oxidoreductase family protein [Hyphomicrobiales bacterium]